MSLAKITRPGLTGIAICVALLWACFFVQHSLMRRALEERLRVVRDVRMLQHSPRPVPTNLPQMRPGVPSGAVERV